MPSASRLSSEKLEDGALFYLLMPNEAFERLLYRGNFQLTARIDYSDTMLGMKYRSGYRVDEVVALPVRGWSLTYEALTRRALIRPPDARPVNRLDYVWDFYCRSKDAGNRPFILQCPRDGRDYLAIFEDDRLEIQMVDYYLASCGLAVRQIRVRGVPTLDDGSLGEAVNVDVI